MDHETVISRFACCIAEEDGFRNVSILSAHDPSSSKGQFTSEPSSPLPPTAVAGRRNVCTHSALAAQGAAAAHT